ncbi:MAG: hypothetical protein AAF547_21600 [Actinomycetota bacterium]
MTRSSRTATPVLAAIVAAVTVTMSIVVFLADDSPNRVATSGGNGSRLEAIGATPTITTVPAALTPLVVDELPALVVPESRLDTEAALTGREPGPAGGIDPDTPAVELDGPSTAADGATPAGPGDPQDPPPASLVVPPTEGAEATRATTDGSAATATTVGPATERPRPTTAPPATSTVPSPTATDRSTIPAGRTPSTTPGRSSTTSTATTTGPPTTTAPTSTVTTSATTTTTAAPTTTTEAAPTTTAAIPPTTTIPPTTAPSTTTTAPPSGDRVVWEETFDRFDSSTWTMEHSTYGDGNNELQCYRPGNVEVRGGRLILSAVTERYTCPGGSTRQVTSGMIRSRGVTFSPGQAIEFRVKLTPNDPDDQGGLWPAVWASSWAGGGWPQGGELDFLEVMTAENPNRAMFSMHYRNPAGRHALKNRGVIGDDYFSDAWHTIRFDYGRNGVLVWYLDGQEAFRVDAADTIQGYPAPFDQTITQLKVNLALGGRPGPLAPGAVGSGGATFEVDYIRILNL